MTPITTITDSPKKPFRRYCAKRLYYTVKHNLTSDLTGAICIHIHLYYTNIAKTNNCYCTTNDMQLYRLLCAIFDIIEKTARPWTGRTVFCYNISITKSKTISSHIPRYIIRAAVLGVGSRADRRLYPVSPASTR